MKNKNVFIFLLILVNTLINTPETEASFTDVSSHSYSDAINYVQSEGIVSGYADETFRPNQTINRAEFTKIVIESQFEISEINNCLTKNTKAYWNFAFFYDVPASEWFSPYICIAKTENIINGYPDTSFKPSAPINFAEASKIIINAFAYSVGTNDIWYKPYTDKLYEKYAVPDSITNYGSAITRGEMAEIIYQLKTGERLNSPSKYNPVVIEESDEINVISYDDSPFALSASREINPFTAPENIVKDRMDTINGFFESLGVSWTRDSPVTQLISWGNIEPEEGKFDFTGIDLYLSTTNVNTLAIIWPMAEWDQKTCHSTENFFIRPCACDCLDKGGSEEECCNPEGKWKGAPCDIDKYKIFLAKLVERYDGDGIDDMPELIMPIKYWEIVNEPDLGNDDVPMPSDKSCKKLGGAFWRSSAKDLADLMKISYETIHSVCDDCKVTSPGFAGIDNDFVQEILQLGGTDYFDIFNFHAYPAKASYKGMASTINKIRNEYGITKEIWLTETGNPDNAKAYSNNKITKAEYYKKHSEFILKQHIISLSLGIKKIFWWNTWPNDIDDIDPHGWTTLALNDMKGNKRPGYYTYKLMVDKLKGLNSVQKINEKNDIYQISFQNKKSIWVAWSDNGQKDLTLNDLGINGKAIFTTTIAHFEDGLELQNSEEEYSDFFDTYEISDSFYINEIPVFIEES